VLLAEHHRSDQSGGPVKPVQVWVLGSLVFVPVRMLGSVPLVVA
jgi:hypothetical protein